MCYKLYLAAKTYKKSKCFCTLLNKNYCIMQTYEQKYMKTSVTSFTKVF